MAPTATLLFTSLLAASLAVAAPAPAPFAAQHLPGNIEALFKRNNHFKRDTNNATIGSSQWTAYYPDPSKTPDTSTIPSSWLQRLNATVALSSFPTSFGPSSGTGTPSYSQYGLTEGSPEVCSFTTQCTVSTDIHNAPDGVLALSFDDGPSTPAPELYQFIEQNNISATHFMIGGNIVYETSNFQRAVSDGGHIAVHTWSHPYMTTLTNEQVVAELGWTMQIIYDISGLVPAFWRPPYGDVDNRVRAIASGVFNLHTVVWNHDTNDWAIADEPEKYSNASVEATLEGFLTGAKSPGLIILEHELDYNTVGVFKNGYPKMLSNGWQVKNVAQAFNYDWYNNGANDKTIANNNGGSIIAIGNINLNGTTATVAPSTTSSTSVAASSTDSTSTSSTTSAAQSSAVTTDSSTNAATSGAFTTFRSMSTMCISLIALGLATML